MVILPAIQFGGFEVKLMKTLIGIASILICANVPADTINVSGVYETEIEYPIDLPRSQRKFIFGVTPDLEITLTQTNQDLKGKISRDRRGIIEGKVDDKTVTFEFAYELAGEGWIEGSGTWVIQDDGTLKGDFKVRDSKYGIVPGIWTLTRSE